MGLYLAILKSELMRKIKLNSLERRELIIAMRKIIGQMQAIVSQMDEDKVTEQTFTQLLAVKGGASRICKEIISKGILNNLEDYTREDLDNALNIIFKLD